MAIERITLQERSTQRIIPLLAETQPHTPQVSPPWLGMKLEQHTVGASARAAASTSSYLVAVCLAGSQEVEYAGGVRRGGFLAI